MLGLRTRHITFRRPAGNMAGGLCKIEYII